MANLNGLRHTCSMSELAIFHADTPSAKQIKQWVKERKAGWFSDGVTVRESRAILCNTIKHEATLQKAGFKTVAQYKGNDRGVVKVMLYIQPKNRVRSRSK